MGEMKHVDLAGSSKCAFYNIGIETLRSLSPITQVKKRAIGVAKHECLHSVQLIKQLSFSSKH